jgi:hypothetical protein
MQDASGLTALKKINEMSKIEMDYVQRHENNFEASIPEANVLPIGPALEAVLPGAEQPPPIRLDTRAAPRMGLINGRFQVRR